MDTPSEIPLPVPIPVSKAPSASSLLHKIDEARVPQGFFCICGHEAVHRIALLTHIRYFSVDRNFVCPTPACEYKSFTYIE